MHFWATSEKIFSWFFTTSAVTRAILKPVYRFRIPNANPQTLKSVDFWCKLSSMFLVAELREQCFELFRTQNIQQFPRFHPWTPLGRAYSCPRLPSCTAVFLLATLVEKLAPPKNCWIRHWQMLYVEIGQMLRIWF